MKSVIFIEGMRLSCCLIRCHGAIVPNRWFDFRTHEQSYGWQYKTVERPSVDSAEFKQEEYLKGVDLISRTAAESQPLIRLKKIWPRNEHARSVLLGPQVGPTIAQDGSSGRFKQVGRREFVTLNDFSSAAGVKVLRELPPKKNSHKRSIDDQQAYIQPRLDNPKRAGIDNRCEYTVNSTQRSHGLTGEPLCRISRKHGLYRPPQAASKARNGTRSGPARRMPTTSEVTTVIAKGPRKLKRKEPLRDPKLEPGTAYVRLERLRTVYCENCELDVLDEDRDSQSLEPRHKCFSMYLPRLSQRN